MQQLTRPYSGVDQILAAEYGNSTNFMTPEIVETGGSLDGHVQWAYEISTGSGFELGTAIVGVSVVTVNENGSTCRRHDLSECFSGDYEACLKQARDHIKALDERIQRGDR